MTALAGTRALAGLALRRDRIILLAWVLLAAGVVASTASSIRGLYTTLAERQQYAATVGANPASAVLGGPGFGLPNLGGIIVAEMGSVLLALIALAGILLVVRYTRTEEETGRAELLGSAAVGRQACLAAALLVVGGVELLMGIATSALLIGYGLPVAGSVALGLAVTGAGWVFAGVAAVAAQGGRARANRRRQRSRRLRPCLHRAGGGRRQCRRAHRRLPPEPVMDVASRLGPGGAGLRR